MLISYGVIHANNVPNIREVMKPVYALRCVCGADVFSDACPACGAKVEPDSSDEPIAWEFERGGYKLVIDDFGDLWVLQSPYYALVTPLQFFDHGVGYLATSGSLKAFCLGPEWFNEKLPCPYTPIKMEWINI